MNAAEYLRQLKALLPPGRLFAELGDKFEALLEAAADEFVLVEEYFAAALSEANPLTATATLEEWEEEYALESTGTTLERQRRIAARRAVRRRTRPADYRERMATLLGLEPWQVAVIETGAAQAALMVDAREVHRFYIYRDPTLAGTYSVDDAQAFLDEFVQSHVKGHVIESVDFLCDDEFSLCDRDLLESSGLYP